MAFKPPTTTIFGQKRPSSLDLDLKRGRRKSSWQSNSNSSDDSSDMSENSQDSNSNFPMMTSSMAATATADWRMDDSEGESEDLVNSVYSFLKVYLR